MCGRGDGVWELKCVGVRKFWGRYGKGCGSVGKVRCGEKCKGCREVCWGVGEV